MASGQGRNAHMCVRHPIHPLCGHRLAFAGYAYYHIARCDTADAPAALALEREGMTVEAYRLDDRKGYLWYPSTHYTLESLRMPGLVVNSFS